MVSKPISAQLQRSETANNCTNEDEVKEERSRKAKVVIKCAIAQGAKKSKKSRRVKRNDRNIPLPAQKAYGTYEDRELRNSCKLLYCCKILLGCECGRSYVDDQEGEG